VALDRFLAANDRLLATLAGERREAGRSATRRPVLLVLVLFVLFGLLHVVFVERPAKRGRSRRHAQAEFGDAIQVARSESEAYDLIAHHVKRASRAVEVTVLNRNNSADRLEAVTPVEPGGATAEGLEGATPASCLAIRLARPHHRSPGDERLLRCDVCGRSANRTTCVPALVGGEVIGAVLVEHAQSLGRESRGVIEQSVAEAAPVVANLRNLAVAELRAATDGLTGLANQRTVHETLKRAAAQAGRTASPLALVIFDLDRFKAVNDTYGHGKGDDVLAAVGAVAASTVRGSDFVGRLGGEEFAILLPDTDRAGALHVAEKLRAEIATLSIPGVDRRITASFGVAVMPDDAGEPDLLLRAADRALYAAKNAGRDRVETTTGPDHVQPELAAHAERD
jgi:diguanylate cyclase (GGDEF)-like protein